MLRLRPITFKWSRINDTVPPPSKNRFSDSGFDLHLVSKLKEDNGVHYYDTGIRVEPENGYYFELVGRSSISKTGWMLANNIGIIDASYRGTIIVPLIKVNPDASPLSLPLRLVQIIPRPLILMMGTETSDLSNTARGTGGFGSSGK
jgi:dUTP pyrophosphatase